MALSHGLKEYSGTSSGTQLSGGCPHIRGSLYGGSTVSRILPVRQYSKVLVILEFLIHELHRSCNAHAHDSRKLQLFQ